LLGEFVDCCYLAAPGWNITTALLPLLIEGQDKERKAKREHVSVFLCECVCVCRLAGHAFEVCLFRLLLLNATAG